MHTRLALGVVLTVVGCAIVSCDGEVAEEDLVPRIAEELCNKQEECDCDTGQTVEQCRAFVEAGLGAFFVPPENADLSYDGGCADDVVDAYADIGCDTVDEYVDGQECRVCKVYYGTKAEGEACSRFDDTIYDDCEQGLFCLGDVCGDPCEEAGEGQSCDGRPCAENLTCTFIGEEMTCQPTAGLGDSCEAQSCADDLVCDSQTFTCTEPPGIGEPCFGSCSEGWCDTSDPESESWVCKAAKEAGEPCDFGDECISDECDFETSVCVEQRPLVCQIQG